ncbi:MAG: protein-(glutamine-N5) methyltransferase, ribosomal protein L3-specific [Pseudomonadota bacterium]|jgi:ribosomal protein L3 glutamine methyltransferase
MTPIDETSWDTAAAAAELRTLSDWTRACASALAAAGAVFGQGTTNALDEARWLVLGSLKLPLDLDDRFNQARLLPHERQMLARRIASRVVDRKPTAYILGEAWLMGLRFRADPRAIIPRSYLAELLEEEIYGLQEDPAYILDLCTGSGCLAIQAGLRWPDAAIVASDLSPEALSLAQENIADYALEPRIDLRRSDLFEAFGPDERFDLILCNPPYVPLGKVAALAPEFLAEPALALGSGDDGMTFIRRLLAHAPARLRSGGVLLCEVGFEQSTCESLFAHEFPHLHPIWLDVTQPQGAVFLLGASA